MKRDIYELAADLVDYYQTFDLYDYRDNYDNDEDAIEDTVKGISNNREDLIADLEEVIEQYDSDIAEMDKSDADYADWKELLKRGKKLLKELQNFEIDEDFSGITKYDDLVEFYNNLPNVKKQSLDKNGLYLERLKSNPGLLLHEWNTKIKKEFNGESLELKLKTEDTVKKPNGKWVNRGDDGEEHGEFKTKKAADAQRKAMFARGYKAEGVDGKEKIVIYKEGDDYITTPESNYGKRISNARLSHRMTDFDSADEIIDYYIKWGWADSRDDFIVIDESLELKNEGVNDSNSSYEYEPVTFKFDDYGKEAEHIKPMPSGIAYDNLEDAVIHAGINGYNGISKYSMNNLGEDGTPVEELMSLSEAEDLVGFSVVDVKHFKNMNEQEDFAKDNPDWELGGSESGLVAYKIIDKSMFESLELKTEDTESDKYQVESYYDKYYRGLEDDLFTNDWSEVEEFAHEHLMKGRYVVIYDTENGIRQTIDPDEYAEGFDGEFPYKPWNLGESKKIKTEDVSATEFNDRYFPRIDLTNKQRYDFYKYRGKEFAYDKDEALVILLFRDTDEEGEDAPWREMDAVGLSKDNWKNKDARDGYLDTYIDERDEEFAYMMDDFVENELPNLQKNQSIDEDLEFKVSETTVNEVDTDVVPGDVGNVANDDMTTQVQQVVVYPTEEKTDMDKEVPVEDKEGTCVVVDNQKGLEEVDSDKFEKDAD